MKAKYYVIATRYEHIGNKTVGTHHYIFGTSAIEGEAKVVWHSTNADRGKVWDAFLRQWGDSYALSYAEAVECLRYCDDQSLKNAQLLEADTTYSFN